MSNEVKPQERVKNLLNQLTDATPDKGLSNWLAIYNYADALSTIAENRAREEFDAILGDAE